MGCCTGNRNFDDKYLEKMTIKVNIWLIRKVMAKIQKNLTAESICFKKIYSQRQTNDFWHGCNRKKNTFFLAKTTKNRIFGGFTPCEWKAQFLSYETDDKCASFLFNIQQVNDKQEICFYELIEKHKHMAIMNERDCGPIFGKCDLFIPLNALKETSRSNLGFSYHCSKAYGSEKANSELAGQQRFLIDEYEVWEVTSEGEATLKSKKDVKGDGAEQNGVNSIEKMLNVPAEKSSFNSRQLTRENNLRKAFPNKLQFQQSACEKQLNANSIQKCPFVKEEYSSQIPKYMLKNMKHQRRLSEQEFDLGQKENRIMVKAKSRQQVSKQCSEQQVYKELKQQQVVKYYTNQA